MNFKSINKKTKCTYKNKTYNQIIINKIPFHVYLMDLFNVKQKTYN